MPDSKDRREAVYDRQYREDLRHWISTDRKKALRLLDLEEAVLRDPFGGIGKPEPLRHVGANLWSRRLDEEHRIVYRVEHGRVTFLRGRGHYER